MEVREKALIERAIDNIENAKAAINAIKSALGMDMLDKTNPENELDAALRRLEEVISKP